MSIEIIGMVGTQDVSESHGSASGPAIDADYLTRFARAHEAAGFDRVLIGYHATGPASSPPPWWPASWPRWTR